MALLIHPHDLLSQERLDTSCFEDSVVVKMAKDLMELDVRREQVLVLDESVALEQRRATQAEAGEKRAMEIADEYRKLSGPSTYQVLSIAGVSAFLGALLWEFARE